MENNINVNVDSSMSYCHKAGGDKKEWNILDDISQKFMKCLIPDVGDLMEDLLNKLDSIKRSDVPRYINPSECRNSYELFILVGLHGYKRQFLSVSTVEKRLRYARFMESYKVPIDFFDLNIDNVLDHFDSRIDDGTGTSALRHEKKTLRMFLKAFGKWDKTWNDNIDLPKEISAEENRFVPFPDTVNKLFHVKYSDDKYENVLLQTIVFTGFNFGMRPPSEIVNLTIDDVSINEDGTGFIRIHETKKKGKERIVYPYIKSVLSSSVFRTPGNYLRCWRKIVVNERSGNTLFLRPDGSPITSWYLRDHITPVFKKVCRDKSVSLYTMRHTFATYFYDATKDIKKTAKRLGHKKSDTIDAYTHILDGIKNQLKQSKGYKRSLFNQALRHINKFDSSGGKPDERDCLEKNGQSLIFSSVGEYGPAEI